MLTIGLASNLQRPSRTIYAQGLLIIVTNMYYHSLTTQLSFNTRRALNEKRISFFYHLRFYHYPVVRSVINPPPAFADENVLMSRGDRLTKFCIFTY